MITPTKDEIAIILASHAKWLRDEAGGSRADLSGANLSGAKLYNAILSSAYLSYAYLSGADLSYAYLSGADLSGAILSNADLSGAILSNADLTGANLSRANMSNANLSRANLSGAILSRADLYGAILSRADLSGANLSGADLYGANLSGAIKDKNTVLGHRSIVPEAGSFTGFKKLRDGIVATIEIPAEAGRMSSLIGRKCRAEFAKVLALSNGAMVGTSRHDASVKYRVGEIVRPDSYDDDTRVECSHGIHFFITRQEAQDY